MAKNVMRMIGCSATGKGTRTLALIRYLNEDKNLTPKVFRIQTKDALNGKFWGLYYKEYNLLIFGNFVKNHAGIYSWQGLDCIKCDVDFAKVVVWYRDLLSNNDINLFCEGNLGWHKTYEEEILNSIENMKYNFLGFESEEEFVSRIIERSGKACRNTNAWRSCNAVKQKLKDLDSKDLPNLKIVFDKASAPVWKSAFDFMSDIDRDAAEGIKSKYENNSELVLRKDGDFNSPSQKFLKYMYEYTRREDVLNFVEVTDITQVNETLKSLIINF